MTSTLPRSRKRKLMAAPEDDGLRAVRPVMDLPHDAPVNLTSADTKQQQSLVTMMEDVRSIITCKICFRLLYEPYTISCGHTYCYSCLCQWFSNNNEGHKKTCPGCRAVVQRAPAPSFTLREMTQKLLSFTEFLSDGETKEQHEQWREQEAEMVERDKAIGETGFDGIFPGMFRADGADRRRPLRDVEDGVERCPHCHWELEEDYGSICPHCGGEHDADSNSDDEDDEEESDIESIEPNNAHTIEISDDGDSEVDEDDLDAELAMEDHYMNHYASAELDEDEEDDESHDGTGMPGIDPRSGIPFMTRHRHDPRSPSAGERLHFTMNHRQEWMPNAPVGRGRYGTIAEPEDDEDEDEDEQSTVNSFIDDEVEEEEGSSSEENDDDEGDDTMERAFDEEESGSDESETDTGTTSEIEITGVRRNTSTSHGRPRSSRPAVVYTDTDPSQDDSDEGGAVTRRHRQRFG